MKKIFLAVVSLFTVMCANASNVEKIQFANAGDFALGVMIGIPPYSGANMPTISVDGMIGIKDGMCNTKTFGQNGAIDLGAYIGFCQYGESYDYFGYETKHSYWELPIAFRAGFNWEFVKNLDVYSGFQGGVAIEHWMDKTSYPGNTVKESGNHVDGVFGMYLGAKWMFTDFFGVKLEYSGDWIGDGHDLPPFAGGVQFNF
ncbi:MAG: hypothetical protein VZQ98_02185 [Bacteroidales bacterium]|nr:hypothetical protein [Bacteroidales bacterium]